MLYFHYSHFHFTFIISKTPFIINVFCLQEAKPYKNDPEILAMTNLVTAYQNNDINEFEKILKVNRQTIMEGKFM